MPEKIEAKEVTLTPLTVRVYSDPDTEAIYITFHKDQKLIHHLMYDTTGIFSANPGSYSSEPILIKKL